tara:strand:+ start:6530 stop:7156 length:627 start_codon:yes stop_codon:yes gene_type:complete
MDTQTEPRNVENFIGIYDDMIPPEFCQRLRDIVTTSSFVMKRNKAVIQDRQIVLDSFHAPDVQALYQNALEPALRNYVEHYPYLSTFNFVSSAALLQVTEPLGGGYHMFHAENVDWNVQHRTLAWMIYLSTDDDGGETEFLYQGYRVRPKEGRICIWPGGFTHLHRGNPPSKTKYIVTGWWQGSNGLGYTQTAGILEEKLCEFERNEE